MASSDEFNTSASRRAGDFFCVHGEVSEYNHFSITDMHIRDFLPLAFNVDVVCKQQLSDSRKLVRLKWNGVVLYIV